MPESVFDELSDNDIVKCKLGKGVTLMSRKECEEAGGRPDEHIPRPGPTDRTIYEQIYIYRTPKGELAKGTVAKCAHALGELLGPVLPKRRKKKKPKGKAKKK